MTVLFLSAPLELTYDQTIQAGLSNAFYAALFTAFFTALFVVVVAGLFVGYFERRDKDRREKDERRDKDRREVEAAERSKALLEETQDRADLQRKLDQEHDDRQQKQEFEFETRKALRESYTRLLIAQRRSREDSLALSTACDDARNSALIKAKQAHSDFIDEYHTLALDADPAMWLELRALRHVLDVMLEKAEAGVAEDCIPLTRKARDARQNLERMLRIRLGYEPLQERNDLKEYDKKDKGAATH